MTSFVNIKYSTQHPGVARAESAIDAAKQLRQGFSGTRGLATLLLSAMAAAVMVVAYQVMDSVTEGHLLVMWIALWAVAFAVLAIFAGTARNVARRLKAGLDSWSRSLAEARADQRLWATAKADARVMADLQAAMSRAEIKAEEAQALEAQYDDVRAIAAPVRTAERSLKLGSMVLRAYQRNYI
ncbi:hypothetical protein LP414_16785 [Polaromonas sp. P1(28)-13]|nr:hypothetical protein LP416_15135 [Polaromonas sp. P2-4]UUZ78259.1 hypothetical protein LP414_16785 [Polaromonas sp. P1(28)-13]